LLTNVGSRGWKNRAFHPLFFPVLFPAFRA
jgi:hypothetical protein